MCCGYAAEHRSAALRQLLLLLLLVWTARLLCLRLLLHYDQGHLRLRWRLGLQPHVCLLLTMLLLTVSLFNATLTLSEKGFYAMSFMLSLFGAVAVQKNVRDIGALKQKPDAVQP